MPYVESLASAQRSLAVRPVQKLFQVSPRLDEERDFNRRLQRLKDASRVLSQNAPEAEFTVERHREVTGSEEVTTSHEVVTESEVTRDATAATQASIAFDSPHEIIARDKSELRLDLGSGGDIKIKVGRDGASLQDLADLINSDSENGGRVVAEVVSDAEGFRLAIATTAAGSNAVLDVKEDKFKTPEGQSFDLIDPSLASPGTDETTEVVTTAETVLGTRRQVHTEEVLSKQRIDDEALEANLQEYAEAFNSLREFVDAQNLDSQRHAGLLAEDAELRAVASELDALAAGFEERSGESGLALADLGLALDPEQGLILDAEKLHAAVESDTTGVVELLHAEEGGLGSDTLAAVEREDATDLDLSTNLSGFLSRLSGREGELERRAASLDTALAALSEQSDRLEPLVS
jgi:flagellar capping protein FliD